MAKIEPGFFTMDLANTLATMTLATGQALALSIVDKFEKEHPGVQARNLVKARTMINTARSVNQLVLGVGSFVMAHPSEGMKVIR